MDKQPRQSKPRPEGAGDGFDGGLRYSWITARTLLTSPHLASPRISYSRRRWDDLENLLRTCLSSMPDMTDGHLRDVLYLF
ncbi:hypothetical protein O988_09772 [Pseudogymnoascus sp. VKM F-3808]|nr:hypothetical protein O988_09772 [Pseudogymnoascus sp. VKM F-3808]